MSFTAWYYPFYLAAVVLLYWRLPARGRTWLLLVASYVFYGTWDARFLALIGFTTLVDFYCVGAMEDADRADHSERRRWFLWLSIVSNLSVLFFFKYFNFFIESAQALLATAGLPTERSTLNILLPVGISFYTFQSIAYSVDVYRRQIHACRDLPLFAVYIAYFPQLVAGPIERARSLLPQLERAAVFSPEDLHVGLRLILVGFFKKLFVANNCALIANYAFALPAPSAGWVALGALAFAFQIYGDFSGYTDIARGSARLLGIHLTDNFRFPYSARGPSDFWQRWHISLSSWFRDYLYIPLGGNRFGNLITLRNLFLTMLIAGLWHGATWMFVLWGAYHGALLVLYRVTPPLAQLEAADGWAKTLSIPTMFLLTLLGWIIFRSADADMLARMLGGLSDWAGTTWVDLKGPTRWIALHVLPLWLLQFVTRKAQDESALDGVPAPLRGLLYWFLFMLTVSCITIDVEFIYFQF
ncbi:MAG: MBOAT family O-acyltransferase [Pseudomonadota bacterium]